MHPTPLYIGIYRRKIRHSTLSRDILYASTTCNCQMHDSGLLLMRDLHRRRFGFVSPSAQLVVEHSGHITCTQVITHSTPATDSGFLVDIRALNRPLSGPGGCCRIMASRKGRRFGRHVLVFGALLIFLPPLLESGYRTAWDLQPETCPPDPPDLRQLYPDDFHEQALTMHNYPWLSAPHFPRMMTRDQHEEYVTLMEKLDDVLSDAGITYVIAGATLMGSYMMHDIMPWDDDIDIWVDLADLPKVKRLFRSEALRREYDVASFWSFHDEFSLENLQTFPRNAPDDEYFVYRYQATKSAYPVEKLNSYINGEYHMFKFFRHDASRVGHWPLRSVITRPWKWPFIDIFFFTQNETHVWNYEAPNKINYLTRSAFFPLHKRPLGRLWLPVPHDPFSVLKVRVPRFQCYRSEHSHQDDALHLKSPVCCASLHPYYPMVTPERGENGVVTESLRLGGKVIQSVHIKGEAPSPQSNRPHDI